MSTTGIQHTADGTDGGFGLRPVEKEREERVGGEVGVKR